MKTKLLYLATAIGIMNLPGVTFGQAPTLGSTAGFAVFTSIGAVTQIGISQITGNVGTNNGSSTGFGNVNGVMNDNNGASALCATDLLSAYNQLNATVAAFFPSPLLGNGATLNAGVYSTSAASTLNGTLTLDAQNNASAIFIFKIGGTFASAAGANVILANGAKACNVFWKVEGAVSLAAGTKMKGTIIANNAAISLSSGATLEGRAMTTSGGITLSDVLAFTPVGCGSPYLTGPASPTLNSTGCYGIFSSNGPVTNTGISFINGGDVGTNVGLTTGFNPLNVSGSIHPIADVSTGTCAADLLTLYTYLNTLPYDINLLYPPQFGNKLVLTPHVYQMNGATTFVDTLFLNGMGNANAVFVISINGALSSSAYASVILTNGTQAKNVFWKVDGAVNLNNYTDFKGTIVANNGAINLATGVELNGRALTTNGSVGTAAINVTVTAGCTAFAPNITTQPINKTLCAPGTASFTVNSTGSNLTYQWRKGSVNLINGGNISGATSPTLIINPVAVSDSSLNYNVIVSGAFAPSDTSNYVSLTVNAPPSITSNASNQISCTNDLVNISVVATGGALTYQWRKGTTNLLNAGNISGVNTPTLTFNTITQADGALDYNVVVMGMCTPSIISANNSLLVNESASITTQPIDQITCLGSAAMFSVTSIGAGLTYQWRKGSVNLVDGGSISGANTANLLINPVVGSDLGTDYNVVITGSCSPAVTSIDAVLIECNDVGINTFDNYSSKSIHLYPNPFSSTLHVSIDNNSTFNKGELRIYNLLGKEVMYSILTKSNNAIETHELADGIYLYTISTNNKIIQSGKLISHK
ncbi:ice-binding family protein [Aurantibacillus circumpalustris]|uniref:ice-binding family protein n=1 Tax=Aurantibacillus circumpalustris TaxID=3036359 RepID=UPI00295C15D8|nr:ice-binding family protein [Aurantibacillus circumpalustris]